MASRLGTEAPTDTSKRPWPVWQGIKEGAASKPTSPVSSDVVGIVAKPAEVSVASAETAPATLSPSLGTSQAEVGRRDHSLADWAEEDWVNIAVAEVASETPPESNAEEYQMTSEEEAELRPKAFRAVVQDDCVVLASVLESVPVKLWKRWENKAGKTLLTLSEERSSMGAYSFLAKALGMIKEQPREAYEERQAVWVFLEGELQPRRATVIEDTPQEADDILLEFWDWDDPATRVSRSLVTKMRS